MVLLIRVLVIRDTVVPEIRKCCEVHISYQCGVGKGSK